MIAIFAEQDSQWLMIVSQDRKGRLVNKPRTNHPSMLGKNGKIYGVCIYIDDGIYDQEKNSTLKGGATQLLELFVPTWQT